MRRSRVCVQERWSSRPRVELTGSEHVRDRRESIVGLNCRNMMDVTLR